MTFCFSYFLLCKKFSFVFYTHAAYFIHLCILGNIHQIILSVIVKILAINSYILIFNKIQILSLLCNKRVMFLPVSLNCMWLSLTMYHFHFKTHPLTSMWHSLVLHDDSCWIKYYENWTLFCINDCHILTVKLLIMTILLLTNDFKTQLNKMNMFKRRLSINHTATPLIIVDHTPNVSLPFLDDM